MPEPPAAPAPPDLLAGLRPLVRQAFAADGDGWCVTAEVVGRPDRWVQVTTDAVNASYPVAFAPPVALAAYGCPVPAGWAVSDWRPNQYVTLSHPGTNDFAVARYAARLLAAVAEEADPAVELKIEELG